MSESKFDPIPEDASWGFVQVSRAWYAETALTVRNQRLDEEITLGLYAEEDGTYGEFSIRWHNLGGESVPQVCIFSDAFEVMGRLIEMGLFDTLVGFAQDRIDSDNPKLTPEELVKALLDLGFEDRTEEPTEPRPPSTLNEAVRVIMSDPAVAGRYPKGLNAFQCLYEVQQRWGYDAFPLASTVDVAEELRASYGEGA